MSDLSGNFERWKEGGKYLAEYEVTDDSLPPNGWTKWTIPAFKYVVSKCTQESYQDVLKHMLSNYVPKNNYVISGAIQEFYNPKDSSGELYLYFPVVSTTVSPCCC
ncbi:AraC family transcriptional regulator [Paenibacillus sp. FSL K6-0276]|uniref:GyrI-like domain-containing protein n=1 Tax=Paenibacillus sp. FSL K6-0276 TaxID=2921450 RepID=UPI0030EF9552